MALWRQSDLESTMAGEGIQTTVYLDPDMYEYLRDKAACVDRSMSDLVNEALREAFREDEKDLAAFEEAEREPTITHEEFLAQLKADGTL